MPNKPNIDTTPMYSMPTLIGYDGHDVRSVYIRAPAYSFAGKKENVVKPRSPGPAYYNPHPKINHFGLESIPMCTIAELRFSAAGQKTPGPGDYEITPANKLIYKKVPEIEMGQSRSTININTNPAPNAYTLPSVEINSDKRTTPKFSFTKTIKCDFVSEGPGPGEYNTTSIDTTKPSAPKHTMSALNHMPGSKFQTPGPGYYNPEKVTVHLPTSPSFTVPNC